MSGNNLTVTARVMSGMLGVTVKVLRELLAAGHVVSDDGKSFDVVASIKAYLSYVTYSSDELKASDLTNKTCSASTLSALWDVTERRVQQLAQQGIAEKTERGIYLLHASTIKYCGFLRDAAEAKKKPEPEYDEDEYGDKPVETIEKARYYRQAAKEKELKNAITEKRQINIDEVRHFLLEFQTVHNSTADSIPGRLCNQLARMDDPAEIRQLLQEEMRRLRADEADKFLALAD